MNPLIIFPAYCLIGIFVLPIYWALVETLIDAGKIEEDGVLDKIKNILILLYIISLAITFVSSVIFDVFQGN